MTTPEGNQSEVARIKQQIAAEQESAQRAMRSLAYGSSTTKRMERIGGLHEALKTIVGDDEAAKMLVDGLNTAHEIIEEAERTGRQICDLLGNGLPADYTQDQMIDAYLQGECTEEYLAERLGVDLVVARHLARERQGES